MANKEMEIKIDVDSKTFSEAIDELAERVGTVKKATAVAAHAIAEGMKDAGDAYKGLGELEELGKIMAEAKSKSLALSEALKAKEMAAGIGEYTKGPTSLDPVLEGFPIIIGTVVYFKEEGWRRVPLRIVEIIRTAEPTIVVKGDYGCNIRGRYDELHEAHIKEIPLRKLTRFLEEHERAKTALDT